MGTVKAFAVGARVKIIGVPRFEGMTGTIGAQRVDPVTGLPSEYCVHFDDYSDEKATEKNPKPKANGRDKGEERIEKDGTKNFVLSPLGPFHDFAIVHLTDA